MPDTFLRNTPNALNAPRNAPTTTAYYIMVDSFFSAFSAFLFSILIKNAGGCGNKMGEGKKKNS